MKPMWYVETPDGGVRQADVSEVAALTMDQKRVAQDTDGVYNVSTVFMGMDHGLSYATEPVLYETMVFRVGNWSDLDSRRYTTRAAALEGHKEVAGAWLHQTISDGQTLEFISKVDYTSEDGGRALVAHVEDERVSNLFLRLQSWDETGNHIMARSLEGRKIKVSITLVQEETKPDVGGDSDTDTSV